MLKTEDLNTMISIDEIHFADWQIWPQLRILLHRGKPVRISARAFDVLVVLVSACFFDARAATEITPLSLPTLFRSFRPP